LRLKLKRLGLPEAFVDPIVDCVVSGSSVTRSMWRRLGGVSGEAPSRRKRFLAEVIGAKLYVSGGVGREGESLDDLFCLDAENKAWSRLYLAESSNKLGNASRQVRSCGTIPNPNPNPDPNPNPSPNPNPHPNPKPQALTPHPHQVCFCGKSLYLVTVGSPGQLDAVSAMEIASLAMGTPCVT